MLSKCLSKTTEPVNFASISLVGEKVLKRAILVLSIDVESDVWALRSGTGLGGGWV